MVYHPLSKCPKCGYDVRQINSTDFIDRQVFDIPLPTVEVTGHRAEIKQCPGCQKRICATFPDDVRAPCFLWAEH